MSLKVSVLGSGSSGNCTYIASEQTRILIDAGLSGKATKERLQSIGVDISSVDAVCVTHEHDDHKASLHILNRRHGFTLYANSGTIEAISRDKRARDLQWNIFTTGSCFEVGDLRIEPFSVPHDSYDPVAFVVSCGKARAAIATDLGIATTLVRERLRECGLIIIESNHDESLLQESPRPWSLKQRIAGRQGHLSNEHAGNLIAEVAGTSLRTVLLAHLSSDCNTEELALRTVKSTLDKHNLGHVSVKMTYPDRVTALLEV